MRADHEALRGRLAEEPVIVLNGPRTVGKSTLLGQLAQRVHRQVIDCDDPGARAAVRNDPARFVESEAPVLIDRCERKKSRRQQRSRAERAFADMTADTERLGLYDVDPAQVRAALQAAREKPGG
jgi:AAA domain